ncbi:Mfa1 family fimbria major subunit [Bacteroides sp.]|uniref:Mfa1 family fimbria major subunit n=1 Tax=Bacteroides sp. TaxID=29523 RepID=UPI003AB8D552
MKTRSFLLSALAALMLAGCSEDAREDEIPGNVLVGKAYLSLSLQSRTSTLTRVDNVKTENGSAEESAVSDVTVLLFDEDEVCLDVVNVPSGDITVGNSDGGTPPTTATASEAQLVPEKTAKVFVVLNSAKWTFTKDAVVGKAWSTINTAIDAVIGDVATNSKFVMASAGTPADGALTPVTVHKPATYAAGDVQKAKDDAEAHPATINVDRLSAKVQVSVKDPGFTKPTGSNFTFNGWELSVTNKSVRLYSDLVTYDNATTGAVYRRDKNYLESEQPDISSGNKEENMDKAFNYLKNIDDVSKDMPAVAQVDKASLYCLENTMEAKAQQLGFTTKVVVKAQYTPDGIAKDASYFSWKGAYYTLAQLKAEYLKHPNNSGLKVDLPAFLIKAGVMSQAEFDEGQNKRDEIVANLSDDVTAGNLNAKTGIIGRFCAVRYYHASVCYYDVLIRHDQNITTKMALGRYGVVRNNWYNIELNSVSGPGTPWIPDPSDPDPTNPTPPDTDDDEADAYLSVQITINPWTYWTQGVDLH